MDWSTTKMNHDLVKMSYARSKISYVLSKMDCCHPESKSWKLPCDLWKPSYNLWKLSTDLWKLTYGLLREIMSIWAHENEMPATKLVYPGLQPELWTLKNRIGRRPNEFLMVKNESWKLTTEK